MNSRICFLRKNYLSVSALLVLTLSFCLFTPTVSAKVDHDTNMLLKEISKNYRQLGDWSAEVVERRMSLGLGSSKPFKGSFRFMRPDHFYYEVTSEDGKERSVVASDGKKAWQFQWVGAEDAPTVRIFEDVTKLELDRYLIFVRGIDVGVQAAREKLLSEFLAKAKRDGEVSTLDLISKDASSLNKVTLQFIKGRSAPTQVVVEDELGGSTQFTISEFKASQEFKKSDFQPEVPKNAKVDVVE